MTKEEIVNFLKEEHGRIEDILCSLGEMKEPKVDQDVLNYHIQARFKDALMYLNTGQIWKLENLLKKAADEDWI